MPVLMVATIEGESEELEDRYGRQQALLYEEFAGPPPGYLAHVCARIDEGLLVVNLVDSEERVYETRPRFAKTAEAVGLPAPRIELHPVVNAVARDRCRPARHLTLRWRLSSSLAASTFQRPAG